MLQTTVFYLFSAVLIASAIMVVAARNPVHAVLFLILCFFNAAGLFLLMGAEFIAFILVIVYVGAVAVLFLFVVMMLDIDFRELRRGFAKYLPVGGAVGLVILAELTFIVIGWTMAPGAIAPLVAANVDNTRALGRLLYTTYFYPFQVSGLILLVAMIGAIVLTLRRRPDARRQRPERQLDRQIGDVIEVRKVESGKGAL
ncbi:MAG TPA: NADH-quinone oxidoreductase subunit J [Alphaproteobacteria bacterium]|nr:NADH-quinone oxidoreductase subunit J [Alphaproteobacteria bacterium]